MLVKSVVCLLQAQLCPTAQTHCSRLALWGAGVGAAKSSAFSPEVCCRERVRATHLQGGDANINSVLFDACSPPFKERFEFT